MAPVQSVTPTDAPTTPLDRMIVKAKELANAASISEIDGRYKLAALVRAVQDDPKRYGDNGVDRLAKAIGRDRSGLYRSAKVAFYWTLRDVRRLTKTPGKTGLVLSWSHLELIAEKPRERDRTRLIERVRAEGLSVRALKREIDPPAPKVDPAPGPHEVATSINAIASSFATWKSALTSAAVRLRDVLSGPRDEATATAIASVRQGLAELRDEADRLAAMCAPAAPAGKASVAAAAGAVVTGQSKRLDSVGAVPQPRTASAR